MDKYKNGKVSLKDIGNENPFSVPTNFFENFALEMDDHLAQIKPSKMKMMRPWIYMVAMFVGLVLIGKIFYTDYQKNIALKEDSYESYVLSQVDETSLMDYYMNGQKK